MNRERTATIVLPDGYESAEAFAKDCGVQLLHFQKRPVAFRVKDYADGWILYDDEEKANDYADKTGALMQGLYIRDGR